MIATIREGVLVLFKESGAISGGGLVVTTSEQARKERIKRAVESLPDDHETMRVQFQDQLRRIPVIRLELASTVLNPESHRIKAQLESHPEAQAAIVRDPESPESQGFIRELLRATKGFDNLKDNLASEGQRDPGIITLEGRLVNANTRAVALSDLGEQYIEVGVLPQATIGEVYDLELDLQVAEDFRQQYSFTNELLFVDDLIEKRNFNEEEVARRLRWTKPTLAGGVRRVQRYVRHLTLIREIQRLSGGVVPLTNFDDSEQTLQELDAQYERLRSRNPLAAERLKQARTLGILVDLGYDRQRSIDADWVESYFAEALAENDLLGEIAGAIVSMDPPEFESEPTGLEDFEEFVESADAAGEGVSGSHRVVEVLVERLGASARSDTVSLPTPSGEREYNRESVRSALNDAMRTAAEDAKAAAKAGDALKVPSHLVDAAAKSLKKAQKALVEVRRRDDFDMVDLTDRLAEARRALDALDIVVDS